MYKGDLVTYCSSCGAFFEGSQTTCGQCGNQITTTPLSILVYTDVGAYIGGHPNFPTRIAPFALVVTPNILMGLSSIAGSGRKKRVCIWVPMEQVQEASTLDSGSFTGSAGLGYLALGAVGAVIGSMVGGRYYMGIRVDDPSNIPYLIMLETGSKSKRNFDAVNQINAIINNAAISARQASGINSCANCGKTVSPDFEICPYCGNRLKAVPSSNCSNCGCAIQPDFVMCPKCGSKLT